MHRSQVLQAGHEREEKEIKRRNSKVIERELKSFQSLTQHRVDTPITLVYLPFRRDSDPGST